MNRKFFVLLILMTMVITSFAQNVTIKAPEVCEVGQRINVRYVVDTQDVEDIRVGDFPGFEYLYGPSTSSQSSYQMINGKTTHSSSVTYTYTILAQKEGEFKLPSASVIVGGKTIRSNSVSITVLPASQNSQNSGVNNHGNASQRRSQASNGSVDSRDLFITATINKTKVFEQEAVLLTYKLYTLVNIRQLSGEMPDLDNFHCQELNSKAQLSLKYENYNGRNYGTAIWRQYVLFPQKSGVLTIPSISFEAEVEVSNPYADPFDVFFGGGSLTQLVRKTITTPKLDIDVKSLPSPVPSNFSGAVGKFSMSGSLTPDHLDANDAASLRVVVSGRGNMKLMKAPVVDVPKDFEVYTPKETDKTTMTASGANGNIVFDYVIVPRHGGKYFIPPVEFVYFNPETEKFITLATDTFHLDVAKGKQVAGAASLHEKEDLRILSSDIHYIKGGSANISENVDSFFGNITYILTYVALSFLFLLILIVFYRQAKTNADIARKRDKRAGKEAGKRLKLARQLLRNRDVGAFYEELLRALLNYVSDKFNISMTNLSKDNVRELLVARGVSEELIQQYMSVLESCEYARFAPGDPVVTMDKIYESACNVINNLNKNL